ncbi:MAG: 2-succinyl-6-hydroxy-2,4-cyclohexadiene-1-carboxylate synthase [Burkholderiales bacterium]|jgi:2-succinyl-6-hydroxy-2,4-cyclohexadiene-1-carboxylate synthase|nr:2-succinyl-6-hydroxy-2,4-cyclohexadiene-1-carboxylate synthase [Burkholderiales bacterium]
MILSSQSFHAQNRSRPTLVFLHGFLGNSNDWGEILPAFSDWYCLAIDLPGHGGSRALRIAGFEEADDALADTLKENRIKNYYLIGYSLGGRIAMVHACRGMSSGLSGLIVESAHPGLTDENERALRRNHDHRWADRFRDESLSSVLNDWYRQPVFSSLSEERRRDLIESRDDCDGIAVAAMLQATSLAKQPFLGQQLKTLDPPFLYLCGEFDQKFRQMADTLYLSSSHVIANAGHNTHRDCPIEFIAVLRQFLSNYYLS